MADLDHAARKRRPGRCRSTHPHDADRLLPGTRGAGAAAGRPFRAGCQPAPTRNGSAFPRAAWGASKRTRDGDPSSVFLRPYEDNPHADVDDVLVIVVHQLCLNRCGRFPSTNPVQQDTGSAQLLAPPATINRPWMVFTRDALCLEAAQPTIAGTQPENSPVNTRRAVACFCGIARPGGAPESPRFHHFHTWHRACTYLGNK